LADRIYYVPKSLEGETRDAYVAHMEVSFDLYERLVRSGVRREQARGILGTAVYTQFVWTVNAWSLMNWLQKRLDKRAQWEHREYARAILSLFETTMPITSDAFKEYVLHI